NGDARRLHARSEGIERRGIHDLPAEVGDALPAVGLDHQPLLAVIHAEGEARTGLVDALEAQHRRAVAAPVADILGADADIAQSLDAHDEPPRARFRRAN